MKCNSCKKELTQDMRHSIASNICPFCGKGILSEDDHLMKNAISKVLIRRGVQSDDQILDISNDIMQLIKIDRITSQPNATSQNEAIAAQPAPEPEMPRPAGTTATTEVTRQSNPTDDAIGRAMAVFERDTAYPSEDEDGEGSPTEDDMEAAEGVLFSSQRNEKAEKLKAELLKAKLTGNVGGFKNKPISRRSE